MVPETRGLSLEQIDLLYRNSSIRGSNAYRQKILEEDLHLSSAGFNTGKSLLSSIPQIIRLIDLKSDAPRPFFSFITDSPKLSEKPSHEEDIKA
jgi:hypothetical protein